MVYTIIKNRLDESTIKYQFAKSDESKLTYAEFIQLLSNKNKEFLKMFRQEMNGASGELEAYFWECVPVSQNTTNREFEFVLVKSEALANINQNWSSFQKHFRKSQDGQVVSFPSLSGDTLVVPIPANADYGEMKDYKNLSNFANYASSEQWEAFWQKVGEQMRENLNNNNHAPRWLSTSGLGVSYLHVRIDSRPKYYSFEEYRHFQTQQANIRQQTQQQQKSTNLPRWQGKS